MSKQPKLCLVASGGGHYYNLEKLFPLLDHYSGFIVTEHQKIHYQANYYMIETDSKDLLVVFKMALNFFYACYIWAKERPNYVITTGTAIAYPFYLLAKLLHKRFIYIETLGNPKGTLLFSRLVDKHADVFLVQWEEKVKMYHNAKYIGRLP